MQLTVSRTTNKLKWQAVYCTSLFIHESYSLQLSTEVLSPEWHMVPRAQVHHGQYSMNDQTAQPNVIDHCCFSFPSPKIQIL